MTRKTLTILGGLVVLGGAGWWMTRSVQQPTVGASQKTHQKPQEKTRTRTVRVNAHGNPVLPDHPAKKSSAPPLSLAASFQAQAQNPLPSGVTPVVVPWQTRTDWVFVPQAIHGQLWFASRQGTGSWHWTAEDLPGMLSPQFPKPVYDSLQWAYDLHENQPGPQLPGAISWSVIAGRVGEPVGWSTQLLPASASPIGGKTLELTVWLPSETGAFTGDYGMETLWNASNVKTGQGALLMLVDAQQVP